MHLQAAVDGFRSVRARPRRRTAVHMRFRYDPDAALHERYQVAFDFVDAE